MTTVFEFLNVQSWFEFWWVVFGLGGQLMFSGRFIVQWIASEKAGFAISYGLGQGATMVAAAWGVFIWKEFEGSTRSTQRLLRLMFLCFIAGLVLIIYSRGA